MCRLLLYGQRFAILCIGDSAVLLKNIAFAGRYIFWHHNHKSHQYFTSFVPLCYVERSEMLKRGLVTFLLNSCVCNAAIFNCVAVS